MDRQRVAAILGAATWRKSTLAVREALRQGESLERVAEQIGIASGVLHRRMVAWDVWNSLDLSGLGNQARSRLEEEEIPEILYALRQLPGQDRTAALRYLLERGLPATVAEGVVEAIKECRRLSRQAPLSGFPCHPGDALALRKWRQSQFAMDPQERRGCLKEGLDLAETGDVRALFRRALGQEGEPTSERPPVLPFRLRGRWMGPGAPWPRPVPYLEDPLQLRHLQAQAGPVRADGARFSAWDLPAGRYVALPLWPEVAGLRRPVVLAGGSRSIPLPAEAAAWEEEGLLVVETRPGETQPGAVVLTLQEGAVRSQVARPEAPIRPGEILGEVILVVYRGKETALPDEDVDADLLG